LLVILFDTGETHLLIELVALEQDVLEYRLALLGSGISTRMPNDRVSWITA
jgi:hypothetical protein